MRTKLLQTLLFGALLVLMVPSMGGCADVLRSVSDSVDTLANEISGDDRSDLHRDLDRVWDDLFD